MSETSFGMGVTTPIPKLVYNAQKSDPVKGDWVIDLDNDKKEFEIDYDDEELKGMFKTKNTFKRFLRKKGIQIAEKYLKQLKAKHSKLDNVKFEKLNSAPYLDDTRLSHKEVRLLFKSISTRAVPETCASPKFTGCCTLSNNFRGF